MHSVGSFIAQSDKRLDGIIARYSGKPGALLGILEEAQSTEKLRYLSETVLRYIAERTGTPLSRVYSVATFYSFFNLKPQGLNVITVCRGTACHTRGSRDLLMEAARRLGVNDYKEEEESSFTTDDTRFTVRTVACFGQCALAPVVAINDIIYSRMTVGKLIAMINKLSRETKL